MADFGVEKNYAHSKPGSQLNSDFFLYIQIES